MNATDAKVFLSLYQKHRFENQSKYYGGRQLEFEKAHAQATWISIISMGVTVFAGSLQAVSILPDWLRLTCALLAALLPVFSTAITAYSSLYGFEQQAKLYGDTVENLADAEHELLSDNPSVLDEAHYTQSIHKYVSEVEKVFHDEQGQWGQLARRLKPQE